MRLSLEDFAERARQLPGWTRGKITVESIDGLDGHPRSFYRAVIRVDDEALWLMANPFVPCVALGEPVVPQRGSFRDSPPSVRSAFDPVRVLDATLQPAHLDELAPVEERQVRYHQARAVGEVLFNVWD